MNGYLVFPAKPSGKDQQMKIAIAVCVLCLVCFHGCAQDEAAEGLTKIDIDFVWDLEHIARSPEVHLGNVPEGTDRLTIYFFDVTANDYSHGGGDLPYDGSGIIPAGAFKHFRGLNNMFGIPKIKATVEAFDRNGQLVGRGSIVKKPPEH